MADSRQAGVERFVQRAYELLGEITYYRILNLEPGASASEVRSSYLKIASRLHPDLFGQRLDAELKKKLTAVYSRVVEAYKVLSNGERRQLYDEQLGQGQNRLSADAEAKPRQKRPEDEIDNPSAKRFFKLGMEAMTSGDARAATMNFKLALSMEPGSAVIQRALTKAESG